MWLRPDLTYVGIYENIILYLTIISLSDCHFFTSQKIGLYSRSPCIFEYNAFLQLQQKVVYLLKQILFKYADIHRRYFINALYIFSTYKAPNLFSHFIDIFISEIKWYPGRS